MSSTDASTKHSSVLHIEVRMTADAPASRAIEVQREISRSLGDYYTSLRPGQHVDFSLLKTAPTIEAIQVIECFPPHENENENVSILIKDATLAVHCYKLLASCNEPIMLFDSSTEAEIAALTVHALPNREYHTLWNSLYFAGSLRSRLLHQCSRMMSLFRDGGLDATLHNWNRVILLHGSPGSGKTSLSRALAQKLAIRGMEHYTGACLAEVNANALHSKYFGESGKAIAKAFDEVYKLAENSTTLVFVLIDEIETIAGSREHAHASNEVGDAIRATNQLLTALDKLRSFPNVLVFCTSNLRSIIDRAFLSRVDIEQYICVPSVTAVYEILRTSMNDLVKQEKIIWNGAHRSIATTETDNGQEELFTLLNVNGNGADEQEHDFVIEPELATRFPLYAVAAQIQRLEPSCAIALLVQISGNCAGMSGRVLRRLPTLALAKYTYSDPAGLRQALEALSRVVEEQRSMSVLAVIKVD